MVEGIAKTVKIFNLAKDLNLASGTILEFLTKKGYKLKGPMSVVESDMMKDIMAHFNKDTVVAERQLRKIAEIKETARKTTEKKKETEKETKEASNKKGGEEVAVASERTTGRSFVFKSSSPSSGTEIQNILRKSNWHDFEKLVSGKKINTLYHFTDKRNIASIKKHGALYSWSYCSTHRITIPFPASNELSKSLDASKSLEDYVRLSFNPFQPMMYVVMKKGVDPFVLEISPEVIYWLDTHFSNINATAADAIVGSTISEFQEINFKLALPGKWKTKEEKAAIQAEVLIKTKLPIQFIRNI